MANTPKSPVELWLQLAAHDWGSPESNSLVTSLGDEELIDAIQVGLHGHVVGRTDGYTVWSRQSAAIQFGVFERLLLDCTTQRSAASAHQAVLKLPNDWVVSHIERASRPILDHEEYYDYLLLGGLFRALGPQLLRNLAERALNSRDADIRELGQDYLKSLDENRLN